MTGWVPPGPSVPGHDGPIVGWEAPVDPGGLGTRELIGDAWSLYRGAARPLLAVAAIPALVRVVLSIPGVVIVVKVWQSMATFLMDFPSRFLDDPEAFQADFEAAVRPPADLTMLAYVGGGVSITVMLVGVAALTAAALAVADGRPVSVGGAFRAVAARTRGIVIPSIAVGLAWAVIGAWLSTWQSRASAFRPSASDVALNTLAGLLVPVLGIVALILAVRWSLAIPAILVEGLGLRRGLARGADMTRGVRLRLGLAIIAFGIGEAFTVGFVALLIGLFGGLAGGSIEAGVVTYSIVAFVGGLLWAPLLPAVLAVAYRARTATADQVADPGAAGLAVDPA